MGPTVRDWALLAVSLAFVAAGLLLLFVGREPRLALLCLLFFGACAVVFVGVIARKRRAARQAADPRLVPEIPGGRTIRADRGRIVRSGVGLVGAAIVGAALGSELGTAFVVLCGLLGLLGLGGLAAVGLGYTGRTWLRLEPAALWVSDGRCAHPIAWDNICTVDLIETDAQPIVRIRVADAQALVAAAEPRRAAGRVARSIGWCRGLYDADVVLLPRALGLDEQALLRAVARYAGDPAARAGLAVVDEMS